ncbi:hypothetical protein NONI108955_36435 [Nocardia ninae]|uniref:Minor tail protein n=1 Tax=Nocardia ninae NBRC 108245 TaxID=1210091 RepID=A0A511MHE4_9NOCA|nr:hypothetical protein [Nocardia ninae]GEM39507.1 hypothetical protein NN4_40260 [Nocardia ninae NBRC 108245]
MAELPPLKYGKVVGRFLANVIDGADVEDLPEFLPLSGTVTFSADAPKVLVAGAQPPATYVQLPKHYECQLNKFGYLTWRGKPGVRLVAPNAATNPSQWTWRVSFDLSYDGDRVPMDSFSFVVPEYVPGPDPANPDAGSIGLVDLTLAAPVPASPGNAVVAGPRGEGLKIDGQVATYAQLPPTPAEGAQYVVKADGLLYVFHAAAGGWLPNGQGVVIRGPAGASDWAGITGKPATFAPTIGATATTAVAGDDPRLTNPRTPTAHTHTASQIADASTLGRSLLTVADAATARTAIGTIADTDTRLTNTRTPTAAGQVYDIAFKSHNGTRALGSGNVMPEGLRIERKIALSSVTYRGETAGTGNLVVEIRKNNQPVAPSSSATITPANQTGDTTITPATPWVFDPSDRLTVHVTTLDPTAGKGLQASLKGMTA